jgi:signal transduction histidine kinase
VAIHKLLARQLSRLGLSDTSFPTDLDQWQNFINAISRVYEDSDNERYLIERSMELSSHEIMELNANLETAQHIAGLGYWTFNTETSELFWSKELRNIMHISSSDPNPNYLQFMEMVHPNDRIMIKHAVEQAITLGTKYTLELRLKTKDGSDVWHYAMGAPAHGGKAPYKHLAGKAMDNTKRKNSELEIDKINQQLLVSAREVGMADVSSSILHNIGNVLNSINVSSSLIEESYKNSNVPDLFNALGILKDHKAHINDYLHDDEKGKLFPEFLIAIADPLQQEHSLRIREMSNICAGVQNIRQIIDAQQSLSMISGIWEKILLQDVMELTLKMFGEQFSERGILVNEAYEDITSVYTDRSKLTQILFNLLQNAKDALIYDTATNQDKKINISIKKSISNQNVVEITVSDNGIGISKENLNKIFTYGFTTKESGHGIGLHSCALCANELGGKMKVLSEGNGRGAAFILELPVKNAIEGNAHD